MTKILPIIKENGAKQRGDVLLSKDLVIALVQKVKSGESLYPKGGELQLIIGREENKKTVILPNNTLNSWITRNNIVPETGLLLRDVLNKAREEYRAIKREEKQDKVVGDAEGKLHKIIKRPSKEPVITMFGQIKDKETGKVVMKENPRLEANTLKASMFALERLDSARYGKIERREHKVLTFSLQEIRRYDEEEKRAERDPVA